MIITGIVEKENTTVWILRIQEIHHRGRITGLQLIIIGCYLQRPPGFAPVLTDLVHNIHIPIIAGMIYPTFAKHDQLTRLILDDGRDTVAGITVFPRFKNRSFLGMNESNTCPCTKC
ncbi:hypothetical protein FQZ97_1030710 [compost metagenome]